MDGKTENKFIPCTKNVSNTVIPS